MKFSKIIFFLFNMVVVFSLLSQEFEVPKDYKLEKKEDYKPYEDDVVACIEYLESTPFDKNTKTRAEASAFLLKWITGCPYIKINLNSYVMEYTQKNKDFLMTFLGGWTKYAIENPEEVNDFMGNMAGIKSIIKVYKRGKGIKKDKNVEKLVKMENDGELESWLKSKLDESKS